MSRNPVFMWWYVKIGKLQKMLNGTQRDNHYKIQIPRTEMFWGFFLLFSIYYYY
ncbi:MAG: hypothetical protein K0S18_1317 [Anaerocolumna sp.]|jgi:hypothetical protein|nr:hypothetical protein [Anaerocolumna sp.]